MTTPPPPQPPRQSVPPPSGAGRPLGETNMKATVALVLGIISLFFLNFPGFPLYLTYTQAALGGLGAGIPALIIGYLAYTQADALGGLGKNKALAGMIMGGIGTLWGLFIVLGNI